MERGQFQKDFGSKDVVRAAIRMALSADREEEKRLKQEYYSLGIRSCAVDYGGDFITSIMKIVERAVVSAKREGVIVESHLEEGAVAGATREALSQVTNKAIGLNVGGKIGVARYREHIAVCVFFGIGLLHLNEISIGLGHRAL
ncbi:MAG: hut operon positive regulator HutP [Clostridiaceae bacterium]|nr:hut operon positive regulator HutP [Clostridiaceae bacterium]